MKHNWIQQTFTAAMPLLLATATSLAVDPSSLDQPPTEEKNHFRAAYRMAFNINASFKNIGSIASPGHIVPGQGLQLGNPGPATGGGVNRTYEDGYNWVDSTGNSMGYTRYWGYDSSSQLVGNSIVMHSTTSSGASSPNRSDDPSPGFELTYARELLHRGRMRGGIETTFGYTALNIKDTRSLMASGSRINDAYALPPSSEGGFVIPPPAPYNGQFNLQPNGNPVISDSPTRTTDTVIETVAGRREFSADIYGLKVGPYLDFELGRFTLGISGGFVLAYVDSKLDVFSNISAGGIQATTSEAGSRDEFLPGAYVAGNISYALSKNWSIFGSGQFQDAGKYYQRAKTARAALDLSQTVFLAIGASYSF
jgi:hypothetical protein